MSGISHEYTANIVCPYCGVEHDDSWEHFSDSECSGLIVCDCGESFYAIRIVDVTYSTEKAVYGKCASCGADEVVIENGYNLMERYEKLCEKCKKQHKEFAITKYLEEMKERTE